MLQWVMTKSNRLSLSLFSLKILWLKQIKYIRGEGNEWPSVQQELCTGATGISQAKPSQVCQPCCPRAQAKPGGQKTVRRQRV